MEKANKNEIMKLANNKRYEFDITVNGDTYAGVHSLPYVTAALRSPDTVAKGYVRTIDGLTKSAVINNIDSANPIFASYQSFDKHAKLNQSNKKPNITAGNFDTNYAAMYYPWVRILDTSTGKLVWVPPSVVMAGVIAFTDKVSHEWFAPAGLLRGGLSDVIEAETRLTHDERDELYEGRVNPIATFPGQGVVVWGQKTLQGKPSALDRVNVRRLLIKLKKFIASSTKFLVFEQNTAATRNRFLNIVNPFLEQVQQNSGLSAFKVVMDDTNNTPDIVDRNILFGQIFIQPTRTAEFIILDFNIMPTGATFPE